MIRKLLSGNRPIFVENLQQLQQLAGSVSQNVSAGDFIALTGGLGSGKTTFTRFLCKALGVPGNVTSPTFTLLNEYEISTLHILHGDLYRLGESEIEQGITELEERIDEPKTLVLLEWAERAPQLEYRWSWHLDFSFYPESESARTVHIESANPDKLSRLLVQLQHDR